MTAVAKHEMDLTTGSILKKLIRFSIPIILVNILQLLFNVADIAVLGMLVGDMEVGAVGSTSALIHLIVNLFIGLSVGTNVVLAKCVGEHNMEKANKIVGTSVLLSVILGFILCIVGFFGARTFLTHGPTPAPAVHKGRPAGRQARSMRSRPPQAPGKRERSS